MHRGTGHLLRSARTIQGSSDQLSRNFKGAASIGSHISARWPSASSVKGRFYSAPNLPMKQILLPPRHGACPHLLAPISPSQLNPAQHRCHGLQKALKPEDPFSIFSLFIRRRCQIQITSRRCAFGFASLKPSFCRRE